MHYHGFRGLEGRYREMLYIYRQASYGQAGWSNTGIPGQTPKKLAQKDLSELTDQELLDKGRKMKLASIANASVVGFMFGVVVYSFWKNTWGLVTLIPLFFIYRLTRNSGNNKELKKLLKERNLIK